MVDLDSLGWSPAWQFKLDELGDPTLVPARVAATERTGLLLWTKDGERFTPLSGKHLTDTDRPTVGDWVALTPEPAVRVVDRLPRESLLERRAAGETTASQALAANVSTAFVMTSLNRDFNPRRLERTIALVWDAGATPVVVLTKRDVCEDPGPYEREARDVAIGVDVHAISALDGTGLDALAPYLGRGQTVALLGSSGVGKSTLTNALAAETHQVVKAIRAHDARGRHTTTQRQLVRLAGGGLLVDMPGLREVGLYQNEAGLSEVFSDVEALADACRYRDCRHESEPGCGVRAAVEAGTLAADRLASYRKLKREIAYVTRRADARARTEEQRKWKQISKQSRRVYRKRDKP